MRAFVDVARVVHQLKGKQSIYPAKVARLVGCDPNTAKLYLEAISKSAGGAMSIHRNPASTKRFPWRIPYSPYRAKVSTRVLCTKKSRIQPRSAGTRLCGSETGCAKTRERAKQPLKETGDVEGERKRKRIQTKGGDDGKGRPKRGDV